MTFRKKRSFCSLLWPFVALALLCLPALAQTQFSGQITSNTVGAAATLANPVYYNETVDQLGVSTTGALSCSAYPQITFPVMILASVDDSPCTTESALNLHLSFKLGTATT
jgi:hypothetical protein